MTTLASISDRDGTILREITVHDYEQLVAKKDTAAIAEMIYHRFYGRYLKPFLFEDQRYRKHYKHGFAMMASACLVIESLESFYQGWEETQTRHEKVFEDFFERNSDLRVFKGTQFYKNVRCGILHQGETTDGFAVRRDGPLFDVRSKKINAAKFFVALERALLAYRKQLVVEDWDSEIWDNLRRKMRFIVRHCSMQVVGRKTKKI